MKLLVLAPLGLVIYLLLSWAGRRVNQLRSYLFTYLLAFAAMGLTVSMVLYPEAAFDSALGGLKIWWDVVFPALLPFFIGAEILMGLGVVHFMGVLLEPFMRPVFNVPGVGSFVMAMGLASGYPIGSIITARLRTQKLISKTEAERLMSFTNTADPLFMAGAVAVGMFKRPEVGGIIMAAHYLSSISVGLVLRFYKRSQDRTPPETSSKQNIILRAFATLYRARHDDGRPLGKILGDAVKRSVDTLLVIGGFIILFSVIIRVMTLVGVVGWVASGLSLILSPIGVHPGTADALVSGLFEITLGTKLSSEIAVPLAQQLIAASTIIAWSGLSVHAQVAAMIQGTDINIGPYVAARVLHAFLAGLYTALIMASGAPALARLAVPALAPVQAGAAPAEWLARLGFYAGGFGIVFTGTLLAALLFHTVQAARRARLRLIR